MKVVEYDPWSGITETFVQDGNEIRVNQSQDLQPFIDANETDRFSCKKGWEGDFHKVASIPPLVIEMWNNELKAAGYPNHNCLAKENEKWFIARLNNSDFLKLRTKEGKI